MDKILKNIAEILNFKDSFFGEAESLGKFGFFELDLLSRKFKASSNYRKLFNLPEKSVYDIQEFQAIIHPDDVTQVQESFTSCIQERKSFEREYRVIVNNNIQYIRVKSVFIYDNTGTEKPVKVVGMKQDITSEKLAEIEKKEYIKKLEQSHELTYSLVHDLKSPINNISMIIELLKDDNLGRQAKDELLEVLGKSCQRSYEIIGEVLNNSVAEENNHKTAKEIYNIITLVEKAVNTFYYIAQKKNIKILTSLQPDISAPVHPLKLQRAVENLLSNAIKFSHKNSHIEVSLTAKKDIFIIKIEDHGLGMNEFQKAFLFHKDNPLRKEGTNGEKSFGLGMNIVKKIIHQHEGKIEVESQEAVGTCIKLILNKESPKGVPSVFYD